MRAIILKAFGGVENFAQVGLPIPSLRAGEVRIKTRAISVNPVDYQIRRGGPEGRLLRSMVLGRDLSGIVDAVADDVSGFRIGDNVFSYVCDLGSSGTYAEYVCVPAELVARKPQSLTHEQAAAVPVVGITASIALDKTAADRASSLFIAGGAGGLGTFAILLARQIGLNNLIVTAGNAKSRAYLIEQCGLDDDQIISYKDSGFLAQAIERNGGHFDIALDFVGGRMLSACCAVLKFDGQLASATEGPGPDDVETLFRKSASFHFVGANAYSLSEDRLDWQKYGNMLESLADRFDAGTLQAPPVTVLGNLSEEVVKRAHHMLETRAVQGKLVMTSE